MSTRGGYVCIFLHYICYFSHPSLCSPAYRHSALLCFRARGPRSLLGPYRGASLAPSPVWPFFIQLLYVLMYSTTVCSCVFYLSVFCYAMLYIHTDSFYVVCLLAFLFRALARHVSTSVVGLWPTPSVSYTVAPMLVTCILIFASSQASLLYSTLCAINLSKRL